MSEKRRIRMRRRRLRRRVTVPVTAGLAGFIMMAFGFTPILLGQIDAFTGCWAVFWGLFAFFEFREMIFGTPMKPGRSASPSHPVNKLEQHIPKCQYCRGLGRLRKPSLIAFFAYSPYISCPKCLGCGKVRCQEMEWWYIKEKKQ